MNNTKERPILMNSEMVQAILSGRKTQTRRIIKPQPLLKPKWSGADLIKNPYGCVGGRLWLRETWSPLQDIKACAVAGEHCEIVYRADDGWIENEPESKETLLDGKWKPSIFMPRWASRINLEITNIRVERLQDITESDAIQEGIWSSGRYKNYVLGKKKFKYRYWENVTCPGGCKGNHGQFLDTEYAKTSFATLWDSINSKRGYSGRWNDNCFVWVLTFKKVEEELIK